MLRSSDLPNPLGSVSPMAIKEANEAVTVKSVTWERAIVEGVTLSSNMSSKLQSACMPLYMATKLLL